MFSREFWFIDRQKKLPEAYLHDYYKNTQKMETQLFLLNKKWIERSICNTEHNNRVVD